MNSEELSRLVTSEYRMPDGTTRRALWERVPELRPTHLVQEDFNDEGWQITLGCDLSAHDREDTSKVNAALIRVAIEDWAAANGVWLGMEAPIFTYPHPRNYETRAERADFVGSHPKADGPNRLASLVGVAHQIADALGVGK